MQTETISREGFSPAPGSVAAPLSPGFARHIGMKPENDDKPSPAFTADRVCERLSAAQKIVSEALQIAEGLPDTAERRFAEARMTDAITELGISRRHAMASTQADPATIRG